MNGWRLDKSIQNNLINCLLFILYGKKRIRIMLITSTIITGPGFVVSVAGKDCASADMARRNETMRQ
jgi:hypothetical protein